MTLAARIWAQSGKITGCVVQGDVVACAVNVSYPQSMSTNSGDESRRSFLRQASAAGGATLACAGIAASKTESLALNGGPKAVTMPQDRQSALTKWPRYGAEEKQAIAELLDNNRFYDEIPLLEQETAKYFGAPHAKSHCNGTSSLISAYFALDLPAGSEILAPSYTAWATTAPLHLLELVPVFVDVDPRTACLDVEDAARRLTPRTRAIAMNHAFGLPCEMDKITAFAQKHGLRVVEDAAQAQGAALQGRKLGTWGDIGCFSFQLSKTLPAVEGGVAIYKTREAYERATVFGNYELAARFPEDSRYRKYAGTGFGSKYRIHPLGAAIARRQLAKLDAMNRTVAAQAGALAGRLAALPGIAPQYCRPDMQRVYWASHLFFFDEKKAGFSRAALLKALAAEGVRASGAPYDEQHKYALYSEAKWWHHAPVVPDLPGCTHVNGACVRLPLFREEAGELIEQYGRAFEKVWAHRESLAKS
jgi:dTDP-4-amino-4,6-dideoxygalactose transaminase